VGVFEALQPAFRTFPNGATAMREPAASSGPGMPGCTQVTEISYTPGVQLTGLLLLEFELATVYTAAVCTRSSAPAQQRSRAAGIGRTAAIAHDRA